MANEENKYFSENQAYFHGFGRAFTRKGQDFVDQAPMKAGHNLDTYSIRSDVLPFIDNEYIIQEDYIVSGINLKGQSILSGIEGSRYVRSELSDVLKFYDGVLLTPEPKSNEQTWQLIDDGNAIAGFVDPTDKFSADGLSSAYGYTMMLLDGDNKPMPSKEGQTWAFNAFNGAVTFVEGETPESSIKIRAFAYVGNVLEDRLKTIEDNLGLSNQSATSGIEGVQSDVNFISGTLLSGFDSTNTVSSAIEKVSQNAALFSLSAVEDAGDFAAQYQLMQTVNGVTTKVDGSIINIPKDQFLSQAAFGYMTENNGTGEWNTEKDQTYKYPTLKLTFALDVNDQIEGVQSSVFIPMHDLINDYSAASGVQYNDDTNTFSIKIDNNSDSFLTVSENGVLLSGVQDAIETAVSNLSDAATAGLTELSGAASGYLSGNAISNKFDEVDGRLNVDEGTITTLKNALNDYTMSGAVATKFNRLEESVNSIHNNTNIVSSFVTTKTVSGVIKDNVLTVDVQISDIPGNAIVVKDSGTNTSPSGLWAQAYRAGDGIAFGPADNDGIIPISATYELPIATTTEVGGVKAGDYIDVDSSTGAVTVKHTVSSLIAFNEDFSFNGSANKTIVAGNYLKATLDGNHDVLTLDVVVNGEVAANNSGLISGAQVYEVSSNLATAITTASEELSGAISGAYTSGMIVIGDADKIVASPIKIGSDRTFAGEDANSDHAQFGQSEQTAATEMTVKNFVNYGLDELATAISGFNAEVEAIA